jgi:hypothetical protein
MFIPDDQGLTGNPVLDFRISAGSILMGTIRPLAFLSAALVCLGVSAWLFVTGMIREEG